MRVKNNYYSVKVITESFQIMKGSNRVKWPEERKEMHSKIIKTYWPKIKEQKRKKKS